MKLDFEYGQGTMAAELPDNTDIFIPGETVKDPAGGCLSGKSGASDWNAYFNRTGRTWQNSYLYCSGPCKGWRTGYQSQKIKY